MLFKADVARHGNAVKKAHDGAIAQARELIGNDSIKRAILEAYNRGVYVTLVSTQAAAGNVPLFQPGADRELVNKGAGSLLLEASATIPLDEVVVGFTDPAYL